MSLVEANAALAAAQRDQLTPGRLATEPWENFPYSCISHHGTACCEVAREWVLATDFAQLNGADLTSGPRWLRVRYKWGPSTWPMHWCEVVRRKIIDCGAHAALSREAFAARGLMAFPTQLVQRYSDDATEQWRDSWSKEQASCHWLDGDHIYHEATAVLVGVGQVKVWDGSAGSWIDPRQPASGYGSVVWVRIFAAPGSVVPEGFAWGQRRIEPNAWSQLAA